MTFMNSSATQKTKQIARFGVSTALAAVLLAGCAGNSAPRAGVSAADAAAALAAGERREAVMHAEAAVAADPHNGAFRALLGNAYLDAGRFQSAQAAFGEAMELGENSPRVALSLALALAGEARYAEAVAVLNEWEGMLAPADVGLAYALAGQPERGIHIMTNAIRSGEDTAKMRQNLAYAYAVAGRWREARLMVAQDLSADQVGDRMSEWASLSSAEAYRHRVANLLQVPVTVQDPGRPMHLALANNPTVEQLALHADAAQHAELAAQNVPPAEVAQAPAMELPAVATPAPRYAGLAQTDLQTAPQTTNKREAEAIKREAFDAEFAAAFAPNAPVKEALASITTDIARYISSPVVQPVPQHREANRAGTRPALTNASEGTHLVQLGSFLTERAALRAWDIYKARYPQLADHQMVITQAVVDNKRRYRVSASGFDRTASRVMCNQVNRRSGDGCISWAAARPLPGAVDNGVHLARR